MKACRVIRRERAQRDVEDAAGYYANEAGMDLAVRFADAVEKAIGHVAVHPQSGSPRYAHQLRMDGLRFWPVTGFPFLVFYTESRGVLDIWRILHAERDIPVFLREDQ